MIVPWWYSFLVKSFQYRLFWRKASLSHRTDTHSAPPKRLANLVVVADCMLQQEQSGDEDSW